MPSIERRALLAASAASIAAAAPAEAAEAIVLTEYWAAKQRGGAEIRLAMYRKRIGDAARPVLFLVHGSSTSARSSFDLSVPGNDDYSMMDAFARYGFDVWTMDHEGYGRSARTDGNSDIASGVEDIKAAMAVVAHETGETRCHFLGESSGALRAAAFAVAAPEHAGRLVLAAHTYTGKGSPTLAKRAEQVEYYRTHNTRLRDRGMIESIFTRDKAGTTDPAVPKALADAELVYGEQVPTGTYLDMTAHLPVVDPAKLLSPVAVVRGEFDGIATMEDLWDFFRLLPSGDKQFSVIAGAAHALATCRNRHAFWHVAQAFLTMPEPPAS
jgi:alpha-beta hydrolase superfamily lysophospholipase